MKRLLFHRDFRGYSGGHGKVWDYCVHAERHPGWAASTYLTPQSVAEDNPWLAAPSQLTPAWDPTAADALFLGGMDWQAYPADDARRPVINLVQHVRHADPAHPLHAFLSRRAIRICVSAPVAEAILATGRVNGPVHVIPAALRLPARPDQLAGIHPRQGIFIGAVKQPELGRALADALRAEGREVTLCEGWLPRADYLAALGGSTVAVLLPHATEGFFLPGLEAMALGCASVVPDCIGNRAYLAPDRNALVPAMTLEALRAAVVRLDDPALRERLVQGGLDTAARFDLQRERAAFHAILDDLDAQWRR